MKQMLIDSKDERGEHRAGVFNYVRQEVQFEGETIDDPSFFLGDWVYLFHGTHFQEKQPPFATQSFHADGGAPTEAVDGSFNNPKDRWKLNDDQSFSLWTYVDAMPEYGQMEPTYTEGRYHALRGSKSEFVLFNGDGSLIILYEKAKSATR